MTSSHAATANLLNMIGNMTVLSTPSAAVETVSAPAEDDTARAERFHSSNAFGR